MTTTSSFLIKGVKLLRAKKNKPEKLALVYTETKHTSDGKSHHERNEECDGPVHQDLKDALAGLAVHLALLTDYLSENKAKDKELISAFNVTGYSLSGEDHDQVIITGYKNTKRGTAVILNNPLFRMGLADKDSYMLIGHLENQIALCNEETTKYITGEKRGPQVQNVLDFDGDGKEDE